MSPASMFEPPSLWAAGPSEARTAAARSIAVVLLPLVAEMKTVVRPAPSRRNTAGSIFVATAPPMTVPRPRPTRADRPLAPRLAARATRERRGRPRGDGSGTSRLSHNAPPGAPQDAPQDAPRRTPLSFRRCTPPPDDLPARRPRPPRPDERDAAVRRAAAHPLDPL